MAKYIFLDIDGTLVGYDGRMSEATELALRQAQKNGHKLIVATGRFLGQVYPWLIEKIRFDGLITSSGANVKYEGKSVFTKFFTVKQLEYLAECYKEVGASTLCHLEDTLIATEEDIKRSRRVLREIGISDYGINELLGIVRFGDTAKQTRGEKSIYIGAKYGIDDMRKLLGSEFNIDRYSFSGVPDNFGEVNLADVSKARGIRELISVLGADMKDTVAIGDGGNDISMIKAAHVGVAMGNASADVKNVADMVTENVDKDGVYVAFKELGLI